MSGRTLRLPLLSLAAAMGLVTACDGQSAGQSATAEVQGACDSAHAVHVSLDSLARIYTFASAIRRYELDSVGVRVFTGPAEASRVVDGAAIVFVDRSCRIISLVLADSA